MATCNGALIASRVDTRPDGTVESIIGIISGPASPLVVSVPCDLSLFVVFWVSGSANEMLNFNVRLGWPHGNGYTYSDKREAVLDGSQMSSLIIELPLTLHLSGLHTLELLFADNRVWHAGFFVSGDGSVPTLQ